MNLPLVDVFKNPYEVWETRRPTDEEIIANSSLASIKTTLLESIADAIAAAKYVAKVPTGNGLSNHIQSALSKSDAYRSWQSAMPSTTPPELSRYQKEYEKSNFSTVSEEINQHGGYLNPGQCLFHGGLWLGDKTFVTNRPLSTSLCPQVAFKNAEYKAKAYDAGRLDLFVLRAINPKIKAFVFKRKGTKLGHESEVLLAPDVSLTLKSETLICSDYPVRKWDCSDKEIPIYVLEIEISQAHGS